MVARSLRLFVVLAAAALAGCQSFYPVPLRDGAFPPTAVRGGERVRIETVTGEVSTFDVASIDETGGMTARTGLRVTNSALKSVQVERLSKRKTFTTLGVIGESSARP